MLRLAVPGDELGRGNEDTRHVADAKVDHGRILARLGDPHREVIARVDRIDEAVVEVQFDTHLRMRGHEIRDGRGEVPLDAVLEQLTNELDRQVADDDLPF